MAETADGAVMDKAGNSSKSDRTVAFRVQGKRVETSAVDAAKKREGIAMGYLMERHGITLMPPLPGVCPECGIDHDPDMPHHRDLILYQYTFYDKHGCWPSWADAMAHCSEEVKAEWTLALKQIGIDVGQVAGTAFFGVDLSYGEDFTATVNLGGEGE